MKIQTRGEFEEACVKECFVFIKYKGKWVEALVNHNGTNFIYLSFDKSIAYLSECIIKVFKPEPPEDL